MEKKILKTFTLIQMIAALVTLGAVFIWSPVCSGMLTLESGAQVHMKCYYTGQAVKFLAIVMLFTAIMSFFECKDYSKFQFLILIIGVLTFFIPTSFIIGVCIKDGMACLSTAIWIKASAIAAMITGSLGIMYGKSRQAQVNEL